ncbi:hypothetical protein N2152v2_007270 [Parachlorella kessleri]
MASVPASAASIDREPTAAQEAEQAQSYSVILPEKLTESGPWLVRRNALSPDKLVDTFPAPDDHVKTLYDNLENTISKLPDAPYLGHRVIDTQGKAGHYKWMTYREAGEVRSAIGSAMVQLGVPPGSMVGLYSVNCPEWVLVDAACHAYSIASVPLYDTLGPDTVEYIANHAELAAVACAAEVLPKLLEVLARCPTVKLVMVYGTRPHQRLPEVPSGSQARMMTLDKVKALGFKNPKPHRPPQPSDLALISYTSGTTGVPKGALLSHRNLVAHAAGLAPLFPDWFQPGDRYISYLPLAHIYERGGLTLQTHLGGALGFYRGNVLELLEDIQELRPHFFPSVPRLWNRIYDKVESSNAVSRALFWRAFNSKKAALEAGDLSGGRMAPFWDALVFSKIRARVGGQVKLLVSGASPISPDVFNFLRICFGCNVLEGYGMTESASACTLMQPGDPTSGHVGAPTLSCEIKLDDIPEMGYTNADAPYPRGEICVRGPTVFMGYYKDEQNTRDTIDKDGWLHTGDVGVWLPGGRLKIIDRKKNIFKLAQGEYIAPEKIENVYARSPFVLQSFVYGNSLRSHLLAVVVPDPDYLLPWAKERGLGQDLKQLCEDSKVTAAVFKSMLEEGRAAGLKGFEQVAAVHLFHEAFSVENDMLTPTFKLKRPQAQARFQDVLADMYSKLPEV